MHILARLSRARHVAAPRTGRNLVALLTLAVALAAQRAEAEFKLLHSFGAGGAYPTGGLIRSGSSLYGLTNRDEEFGGVGNGTIFRIGLDGSNYQTLHNFAGSPTDGAAPLGSLLLDGTSLYGTTYGGKERGTLFRIDTSGSGYQIVHEFKGGSSDGANPRSTLIKVGTSLFGTTEWGGRNDELNEVSGTVFRYTPAAGSFVVTHVFSGPDGASPQSGLMAIATTLYGMTESGGANGFGTIFRTNTTGSFFELLHTFSHAPSDGAMPVGELVRSGQFVYGLTRGGGTANFGTIFRMRADGQNFQLLHSFQSSAGDGQEAQSGLILSGSTLYGMKSHGGAFGRGTLFQINLDGSDYKVLHHFAGGAADGATPLGSLLMIDDTLYGMTQRGGAGDRGTIFSFIVPEPSSLALSAVGAALVALVAARRYRRTIALGS